MSYLHEVFAHFGVIRSRKMFGGHGLYHNDLMFALVADDELYLKADKETIPIFAENDLGPFEFDKDGKIMRMSYYKAPEEIYDDPEQASYWAKLGYEAEVRANNAKNRKKKRQTRKRQT